MYYKAKLQTEPAIKMTVDKISEEEAYGKTTDTFWYRDGNTAGEYAIRKSKKAAITALTKQIKDGLKGAEKKVVEFKALLKAINEETK